MGTTKLYAPKDSAETVNVEGEAYKIVKGIVEVPNEAIGVLLSHGFTTEKPAAAPATP